MCVCVCVINVDCVLKFIAVFVWLVVFYQNISTLLVSQEPVPLMPNHLVSAVVEHHHNKLSPVEMDELMLDDGMYSSIQSNACHT